MSGHARIIEMPLRPPFFSSLTAGTSAGEGVLDLFRRGEAELARGGDLDDLAGGRIATLARRTVLHLELAEAREIDLLAFPCGIDDAGQHRVDGPFRRVLLHARFARNVIDQFGQLHSESFQVVRGGQKARERPDVTRSCSRPACGQATHTPILAAAKARSAWTCIIRQRGQGPQEESECSKSVYSTTARRAFRWSSPRTAWRLTTARSPRFTPRHNKSWSIKSGKAFSPRSWDSNRSGSPSTISSR